MNHSKVDNPQKLEQTKNFNDSTGYTITYIIFSIHKQISMV